MTMFLNSMWRISDDNRAALPNDMSLPEIIILKPTHMTPY